MKVFRRCKRENQGASIIVVALSAVVLIFLVWAAFQVALTMGGSREVRNAVDAAVLNVSKHAVDVRVPAPTGFDDVADMGGQIGISNVNRLLGKAYLINANAQEMQNSGQSTSISTMNAENAYQYAQDANDQLCSRLKSKQTFDSVFNSLSANKPAKLLGQSAVVTTSKANQTSWATAMLDRGDESNIYFNPQQLPQGAKPPAVRRSKSYLAGYLPFSANGKQFCLASFHNNEMPHLVSDSIFKQNRSDVAPLSGNPVPNAFQESGIVDGSNTSLTATACGQANPLRQWNLAIPHSYVSITFGNKSMWYLDRKYKKTIPYNCLPGQTVQGFSNTQLIPPPKGIGGTLNGYAELGNEYKAGNIWMLYQTIPCDKTAALQKMLQRIQEIDPNFTLAQLQALMQSTPPVPASQSFVRYIIYPQYRGPDCTNPIMKIGAVGGGGLPGWLALGDADGTSMQVVQEQPPITDGPFRTWDTVTGGKTPSCEHWATFSGTISWNPGTGMLNPPMANPATGRTVCGQCLGELQISRVTSVYFDSEPPS